MPTISEFFGILIRMYYDDHNPPHFHVYYGEYEAIMVIETMEMMKGELPQRVKILVMEWAIENRQALLEDWHLAEHHQPLNTIQPLE